MNRNDSDYEPLWITKWIPFGDENPFGPNEPLKEPAKGALP